VALYYDFFRPEGGLDVERTFTAGWGDMDFNSHMRNTVYFDKSADVRMTYFAENGFRWQDFCVCAWAQ